MNYFDLLQKTANSYPTKAFLISDGKSYSYSNFCRKCVKLSKKLTFGKGGRCICIYSSNVYFQALCFFAVQASGNIPLIAHHPIPTKTLNMILQKNGMGFVLTDDRYFSDTDCISLDEDCFLYTSGFDRKEEFPSEICMGVFTSGSTGIPKVLFRTYESWAGFFPVQNQIFQVDGKTRFFMSGSLSFTGNLNFLVSVLFAAGTAVLVTSLQPKIWAANMQKYKVTHVYLIPTKLKLLRLRTNCVVNSVKMLLTGSQILTPQTASELKQKFPKSEIIAYYGASELNYVTYLTYSELLAHPQSVGKPFPEIEVNIGSNGYIYVNTPYHTYGLSTPCTVYDMGYFDPDGYLVFEGRDGGIINCGGFKINILKVEQALASLPYVTEAAVIDIPDSLRGSEPAAFVTLKYTVSTAKAKADLREKLSLPEIPKKFIVLNCFPLNSSGKIDRIKLKKTLLNTYPPK